MACHISPRATRYTLLDQSPPTSEIECLCMDVDDYKIVNVYKPPSTQVRFLDLPVFPISVSMPAISTVAMLIRVTMIIAWKVSAWMAGRVITVLPSSTMPRLPPAFTPAAGRLASIQI